jgi:acetyl esterase/lipase
MLEMRGKPVRTSTTANTLTARKQMKQGQRLEKLAIGDSSGGGLAAAVVLKMRD